MSQFREGDRAVRKSTMTWGTLKAPRHPEHNEGKWRWFPDEQTSPNRGGYFPLHEDELMSKAETELIQATKGLSDGKR